MRCTLCPAINTATPIAAVQPLLQIACHVQMMRLPLSRAIASALQAANKAISVRVHLATNMFPSVALSVTHRTVTVMINAQKIAAQAIAVIKEVLKVLGAMLAAMIIASFANFLLRLKRLNRLQMLIRQFCHYTQLQTPSTLFVQLTSLLASPLAVPQPLQPRDLFLYR